MTIKGELHDNRGGDALYPENPWLYADEASLYSIEEDSREDRTPDDFSPTPSKQHQDMLSRKYGGGVMPIDFSTKVGEVISYLDRDSDDVGVEVRFEADDDDDNMSKESDDRFLFYDTGLRRCRMMSAACVLCLFIVAVVLSVTLAQLSETSSRATVSKITNQSPEGNDEPALQTDRPTASPIAAAPSQDAKYLMSENYVYEALRQCQGTGTFFDEATAQGLVFLSLVDEVYNGTTMDATGAIAFDKLHSQDYLREKFALSILYASTNGNSWTFKQNWLSASDPCVDWSGVVCANGRVLSSCAVTGLELCTFLMQVRTVHKLRLVTHAFCPYSFQQSNRISPRGAVLYALSCQHRNV
jgi:hypothetical protein